MKENSNSVPAPVAGAVSARFLAKRLGISAPTLRRLSRAGAIPSLRIGSVIRYDLPEVMAAVRQSPATPRPPLVA